MIKPGSLRGALAAAIPTLAENPDKLTVFIDQGSIAATGAKSSSFEYRYVLNVLVLDYAGEADDIFIAVVDWVRAHQSDLVTNWDQRDSGITYEIDILGNNTADVSVKLQLTESVVVKLENGVRTVTHVDDSQSSEKPWEK
ncbi:MULTISPECIES: phage tail protein [unclassified Caballeronia]|uniref:phage tail protein n=1 Tax=unclassified Caballeronia TaxID=2646786 RepID=UPI002863545F|nr:MULTISPECIES: phage tail protein [unclassified Caballeronia]MDR5776528.1 phage tail protein [Caballeronia sp. LZ002]MDR5851961.1 phage tail protein [Caballeronia sp. LZ003]